MKDTVQAIGQKTSDAFLYRHIDAGGSLLYVGVTSDTERRLYQHKLYSPWAEDIADIKVECFPTREDALAAERKAIETERPRFNSTYSFPLGDSREGEATGAMTASVFKAIRHKLRLTQAQLSRVLRYETALTVSTYERDKNPRQIPTHVALLMEAYRDGYRPADWPLPGRPTTSIQP